MSDISFPGVVAVLEGFVLVVIGLAFLVLAGIVFIRYKYRTAADRFSGRKEPDLSSVVPAKRSAGRLLASGMVFIISGFLWMLAGDICSIEVKEALDNLSLVHGLVTAILAGIPWVMFHHRKANITGK